MRSFKRNLCYAIESPFCNFASLERNWGKWNSNCPGYPIDGNRWSENQSINRYQSIKLVNWYRLISVNRWSIDNHTKTVHRLLSIGTITSNRRRARYLYDQNPILGGPGDEVGKTNPAQSSQRKEYPVARVLELPLARHSVSVSLCRSKKSGKRFYWIEGISSKAIIFAVLR